MTQPSAGAAAAEPAGEPSRCPRCGAGFDCGVAGPGPCACAGVALDAATLAALRQRYPGRCLCGGCLRSLAATGVHGVASAP